MFLHHVSICTTDMDAILSYYKKYFGAVECLNCHNPKNNLKTCFLQFEGGAMIEVMTRPSFGRKAPDHSTGFAHISIFAGSKAGVDKLAQQLQSDGHPIISSPKTADSGFYECTAIDPDGNWVEITGGP